MVLYALVAGAMVAGLAGLALLLVYALCRLVLDRRRLAAWESAWDRTGPRWDYPSLRKAGTTARSES
jgi:hypothetical protein